MANSSGWGDGAANNAIGWGQGANNNIGWGSSHATSWAGATDIVGLTTDADAQAFITAAAITDATQQTAINNLVVGMKADGIWTKMKAIYPFVGGTATTHKYNLKDPRDLDAAFRLVFNGGWTHSSTGATPSLTNGYADTKLNLTSMNSINDISYGYYSRTNSLSRGGLGWDYPNALVPTNVFYPRYDDGNKYGYIHDVSNNGGAVVNCQGLNAMSRVSSTLKYIQLNSTINTFTSLSSGTLSSKLFTIAATSQGFENRQNAFTFIGDGLSSTELSNLYTRVQAFQTSLSRQV